MYALYADLNIATGCFIPSVLQNLFMANFSWDANAIFLVLVRITIR